MQRLSVGGDSSQPRAGEQGSSSSSTNGQVIVHSSYKFAGIRLGLLWLMCHTGCHSWCIDGNGSCGVLNLLWSPAHVCSLFSGMPHGFSGSSLVTTNEWPYKPGPRLKKPCTAASAATGLWWKNYCYIDRDLYQLVNKVWISFEGFHGDGSNSQNRRFTSSHQSFQQKQFHDDGVFGPAKIRKCAQWHRAHSCHADLSQLFRIVYTIYIALTDIDSNDILVFIAEDMNRTLTYWCVLHRIRCQCNYSKHE